MRGLWFLLFILGVCDTHMIELCDIDFERGYNVFHVLLTYEDVAMKDREVNIAGECINK